MYITFNEFAINKAETMALCSDDDTYSVNDIHNIIGSAQTDYEYQFKTSLIITEQWHYQVFDAICELFEGMGITVQ